ncbi:MAG: hypothetical protein RLZZ519_1484 [Bacteroidota bacterium]|jgi:hypothetical protein
MARYTIGMLGLCLLLLAAGCKPPKQASVSPLAQVSKPVDFCGTELSRGEPAFRDPLLSMNATVEGECLRMTFEFAGGCKEHDFDLYWNGEWDRTTPPVAHFYVSHDAHGDACEAIKVEKRGFVLEQVRFPGNRQVIVNIHAEGCSVARVSYTYK